MPLVSDGYPNSTQTYAPHAIQFEHGFAEPTPSRPLPIWKQNQHSFGTKTANLKYSSPPPSDCSLDSESRETMGENSSPPKAPENMLKAPQSIPRRGGSLGAALTDTPATTAPNSPRIPPTRQDSGSCTPFRNRGTTLDIPGLTKTKHSPDGRIAQRDVGAKLVIVMVGLPARGKSYLTNKIARYLNWIQHDTKIFNVGERRREATGGCSRVATPIRQLNGFPGSLAPNQTEQTASLNGILSHQARSTTSMPSIQTIPNEHPAIAHPTNTILPPPAIDAPEHLNYPVFKAPSGVTSKGSQETHGEEHPSDNATAKELPDTETLEQTAEFFDPENTKAAQLREQVAMSTLDELLDYILDQGGSVGIFDATNSTITRRQLIMNKIRSRAGPELGVLFLESSCVDENLLESNMRLKLSGPDYKDQDPVTALADFKKRVALYEKQYVPLGDYEERNNMPYVQIIDVGRKVNTHMIKQSLSAQTVYYLLNFNLSPRQIWITRHGESIDNVNGKIGGDSDLSINGQMYGKALTRFILHERQAWEIRQEEKARSTHFPPRPGDTTPPNPECSSHCDRNSSQSHKSFSIWTSMLKRSIQTAQYFDEDDFDVKQMKMLDELNAGTMEGMTYEEIRSKHNFEYDLRKRDKLHYRYPGAGGEGYLDIINRLKAVIVEIERMTDHVLLVGHRSVARVLLAYFKGLKREDVADLDVPLGMLYMLEPKPFGVDFKAYRYNPETDWFHWVPNYELRPASTHCN